MNPDRPNIIRSKSLSTIVLVLYTFLYLCLAFHFHPVDLQIDKSAAFLSSGDFAQVEDISSFHCEGCHLQSNFTTKVEEEKSLITFFYSEFILHELPSSFHSVDQNNGPKLRAPPTA